MAEAMGITGATLTHHLNALESQGLVRRWRDSSNRRVQQVELTEDGEELFVRLRQVAARHDQRLRGALGNDDVVLLEGLLDRLHAAVAAPGGAPAGRSGGRSRTGDDPAS